MWEATRRGLQPRTRAHPSDNVHVTVCNPNVKWLFSPWDVQCRAFCISIRPGRQERHLSLIEAHVCSHLLLWPLRSQCGHDCPAQIPGEGAGTGPREARQDSAFVNTFYKLQNYF